MLITICFFAVFVISIILLLIDGTKFYLSQAIAGICVALLAISVVGLLACGCVAIGNRVTSPIEYQDMAYEKEVLEYRLEQIDDKNDIENGLIYNDIVAFNNKLRHIKNGSENIWTNWFVNNIIAENIDYIEISNSDFSPENIK